MDTTTVLQIIAMLDTRIAVCEKFFNGETDEAFDTAQEIGKEKALTEFRDHLQEYIELQVNYAENALGE
jgi:uncharacterized protein YukE